MTSTYHDCVESLISVNPHVLLSLSNYLLHTCVLPLRAHAECSKSTSSETDLNDNLPSHRTPTSATSSAKHTSHNGFFPQHPAPASASSIYDSPPSRGASLLTDNGLYHLPRSYSQDTVLLPKSASSPSAHLDSGDPSELYVFTPSRKTSMETQMRNVSISYDIPPTPGANSTYQVPRTLSSSTGAGGSEGGDAVPPPRPPKPSLGSTSGPPPPPAERSPTDNYCVPRSVSETDGNYCVPTSAGNKALRSNTIGTVDCSRLRKGLCHGTVLGLVGSQAVWVRMGQMQTAYQRAVIMALDPTCIEKLSRSAVTRGVIGRNKGGCVPYICRK